MHFLFNISLPKLNVHSMQSLPGGKETSKKWNDQIQEAEQDFSQRDKLMVKLKFHNRNIIQATMMISVTWNMRCQEANVWALNHERGFSKYSLWNNA